MNMHNSALVGSSGFVGSVLQRQVEFAGLFRSSNIEEIGKADWGTVVCAAAPAAKWIANREPEADLDNIKRLMVNLQRVRCERFVLISTVDVFSNSLGVDESSAVEEEGLHSYGLHRRLLEQFVESEFRDHLIVRLPGLVGPGLKKNVIFDFLHNNELEKIDSRGVFQFYPMINLYRDLRTSIEAGLKLVHLTAEPVSVAEVAEEGFSRRFDNTLDRDPASYDMRSQHAQVFGGQGDYQYSKRESLQAIRAYAQSEPGMVVA